MVTIVKKNINWRIWYITYHFDLFYIQPQYEQSTTYRQLNTVDLS